jgi:hypothetical protein
LRLRPALGFVSAVRSFPDRHSGYFTVKTSSEPASVGMLAKGSPNSGA